MVYPIGIPPTEGRVDPDVLNCGYGELKDLKVEKLIVSQEAWNQFLMDYP